MAIPHKLSRFDLQIMEAIWSTGSLSIREIQQTFPVKGRPAYTTVQTMVNRLEARGIVQRIKKISNAHIYGPLISREDAQHRLITEFLGIFGGRVEPLMTRLIEAGKLSIEDIQEAEKTLRRLAKKRETP